MKSPLIIKSPKARFTLVEVMIVLVLMLLLFWAMIQVFVMQRKLYQKAMSNSFANEIVRQVSNAIAKDARESSTIHQPEILTKIEDSEEGKIPTWPEGFDKEELVKLVFLKQRVNMVEKKYLNKAIDSRITYYLKKGVKLEDTQLYKLRRRVETFRVSDSTSDTEEEIAPRVDREIGDYIQNFVPFRVRQKPPTPENITKDSSGKPPFTYDIPWHDNGGGANLIYLRLGVAARSSNPEQGKPVQVFTQFFVPGHKTHKYR